MRLFSTPLGSTGNQDGNLATRKVSSEWSELDSREKEVVDIMITLFDKQEIEDRYLRNTIREAVAKAVTENSEKKDVEYPKNSSVSAPCLSKISPI